MLRQLQGSHLSGTHTNGISLMCYKMFFSVQFNTTICRVLAADMLHHTINKLILVKKSVDRIMNFMQSGHFMIGSFYDTWVNKFFCPFDIGWEKYLWSNFSSFFSILIAAGSEKEIDVVHINCFYIMQRKNAI